MDGISSQPAGAVAGVSMDKVSMDKIWQETIKEENAQKYAAWKRVAELQSQISTLELEIIETKEKLDATQAVIEALQRSLEFKSKLKLGS